jgi:trehalose 6-phosphate phosphatase
MTSVGAALDFLASAPEHTAMLIDFDGTLSRIVTQPELARPLPGVPGVLKRLANSYGVLGVVSGRPAAWLVEQLELSEGPGSAPAGRTVEAFGLHGIEHAVGGAVEVAHEAASWTDAVARARDEASAAGIVGLVVEDKRYSLTLHWRAAADPAAVSRRAVALGERLAAASGLHSRPGKASIELIAPIGIDKGTVVAGWADSPGIERVAFFGDDMSDVPAFDAVDRLAAAGRIAGLKVAVTGLEAPSELLERADVVLIGPEATLQLLEELAVRIGASPG